MANDITEKALNEATLRLAWYCESDVINTYRVWLRYELFRGKLNTQSYEASEANLQKFLEGRNNATSQTIKTMESELIVRWGRCTGAAKRAVRAGVVGLFFNGQSRLLE